MLTVAVRDFDPRRGEANYRLTNIRRGEPDAALMKVPADYTRSGVRAADAAPECEGTSHLRATASKRQDWWCSKSSI
jgi:hypothetical protein